MRNVTITLDDDLARWARVKAASEMKSLSRFLADTLSSMRDAELHSSAASSPVRRFLDAPQSAALRDAGRDSLHDRQVLR